MIANYAYLYNHIVSMNTQLHASIKAMPFEVVFGIKPSSEPVSDLMVINEGNGDQKLIYDSDGDECGKHDDNDDHENNDDKFKDDKDDDGGDDNDDHDDDDNDEDDDAEHDRDDDAGHDEHDVDKNGEYSNGQPVGKE